MRAVDPVVVRRSENGDTKKNRTWPSYNRGMPHTQKKNRKCDNDVFVRPSSCKSGQCEHEQSAELTTGDNGTDRYQDNQDNQYCQDYQDDLYYHEDSSAGEESFAFTSTLTNNPNRGVVGEKKTRLIVDEKGGKTRLVGDNLRIYLNDDPEVVARYETE